MTEFFLWSGWPVVSGVAAAGALAVCIHFMVFYHLKTAGTWWRHADGKPNPFGRYLFFRKALLAALMLLVVVNRLASDWDARHFVTAVVFVAFAIQTIMPYRLLLQAQKDIDSQEAKL